MKRVCVVGGAALDITGVPNGACNLHDSNPGRVRLSAGGVGHNIASRLARYDMAVSLITALGNDFRAEVIAADCAARGIDLSRALAFNAPSATYLSVLDGAHDLLTGISDMDILSRITPERLEPLLPYLSACDMVVLDANLSEETLAYLTDRVRAPLFYEPVSCAKSVRIGAYIGRCAIVKPNRYEAEALTGCACEDAEGAYRAAERLVRAGVARVFISMASDGVVWADANGHGHIPGERIAAVDTTGAGDAMCAAIIHNHLLGESAERCAALGNRAGARVCAGLDV